MAQVAVVDCGSSDGFDYLIYPEQHPANQQYFYQEAQRASTFNPMLMEMGQQFMRTAVELYNRFNDSDIVRSAKAAVRRATGFFHPNSIHPLEELEDLRNAQPTMQRYIMAEPGLRQLYQDNKIDGYADDYVDLHPDKIGTNHYDYRRATQSVIMNHPEFDTVTRNFYEDLEEGDRELSIQEKGHIMTTWEIVEWFTGKKLDVTDKVNEGVLLA